MINYYQDVFSNSPLFHLSHVEQLYASWSDRDLRQELEAYGTGLMAVAREPGRVDGVSVCAQSGNLLQHDQLVQLLLYTDRLIIPDPLFPLIGRMSPLQRALNDTFAGADLGTARQRAAVAQQARYLKSLEPALRHGFIHPMPLEALHGARPIFTFSSENFEECVPPELRGWFRERAVIRPVRQVEGHLAVMNALVSEPCSPICVGFGEQFQMVDRFVRNSFNFVNEPARVLTLHGSWDVTPTAEEFDAWIGQCVNRAASKLLNQLTQELAWADQQGCLLLTNCELKHELLQLHWQSSDSSEETTLNNLLRMELPLLTGASLETLCQLRAAEGQALASLRIFLSRKLSGLRSTADPASLHKGLKDIAYEIQDIQIREVEQALTKAARQFPFEVVAGLAAFFTVVVSSMPTGVISVLQGLGAGATVAARGQAHIATFKQHPGFFLWKVREKSRGRRHL